MSVAPRTVPTSPHDGSRTHLLLQHTAPGSQRVREEWESLSWLFLGGTALLLLFGSTRPNTNPHDWARDEAAERLRRKAVSAVLGLLRRMSADGPLFSAVMQAGEEVLFGVHYAGIRFMRERGVVSPSEAAELEAGLVVEPPAPTQLRRHYPHLNTKPLFEKQ